MKWVHLTIWMSLILLTFVNQCHTKHDSVFTEEEEPAEEDEKVSSLSKLGISSADIEDPAERADNPPLPQIITPGDEYISEANNKVSPELKKAYENAILYMERGRGHGAEGRRAAYKILDQLSEQGHKDAQKLMAFAYLFGDRARWSVDGARKFFTDLAEEGSPDAQLGLAFMHATGIGMEKSDQARALIHYTFSALGGNPLAQMAMGYRYHYGVGVTASCESALTYYEKVAKKVVDGIKFSTSLSVNRIRLTDENEPTSGTSSNYLDQNMLDYYKFLAEKGESSAQVGLGQLFLSGGRGVEQNFELAFKYFAAAADNGHPSAYAHLGKMYLDGTPFTPQNNASAFNFFLRSAEKENAVGQAGLGLMYLQGRGTKHNLEKAYKLFNYAALKENGADGQLYLGEMYYTGNGVKRDFKTALKYFQLASQNGNVVAYYNLARMHSTGIGVPRSCSTAVELYKIVSERGKWSERLIEAYSAYKHGRSDEAAIKYLFMAELGYEPAQTNFAYILDRGESSALFSGGKQDLLERAIVQWQRAANQEYWMARVKLGDYYYYGWGTEKDYNMAAQQYKHAADRHMAPQAMFNLGYMHENGLGLSRDLHLAKRFYDQAADHSADAFLPVMLALTKLGLIFILDQLNKHPLVQAIEGTIGPNWDIALMVISVTIPVAIVIHYLLRPQENVHFHED
ncbi:unnamed protein product [Auanema sp. JU1783]|nr:unnamed protein product [Auanema sp. JU1783]